MQQQKHKIKINPNSVQQQLKNLIQSMNQDNILIKFYKLRFFLLTRQLPPSNNFLNNFLSQMLSLALDNNFLGEYQQLHEILHIQLPKSLPQYSNLRHQMIQKSNKLRVQIQHVESIGNYQLLILKYFTLAQLYKQYTMHKQANQYYSKLFRLQYSTTIRSQNIIKKENYFTQWANEMYLKCQWNQLSKNILLLQIIVLIYIDVFLRYQTENSKKIDCNLAILKDLKLLQSNSSCFFENLLHKDFPISQFADNTIISFNDISYLYSLVVLATKSRQFMKNKTKFSSQIQFYYLRNDFRTLLQKIQQGYQKTYKFHPLIFKLYPLLIKKINQRILKKYLSFYFSTSLQQIQKNTKYTIVKLKQFLFYNPNLPYLIDPISSSVVYYQKMIPIYQEVVQFNNIIQRKYMQKMKVCMYDKRGNYGGQLGE